MNTYHCSECENTGLPMVTTQGGVRHEAIPQGWAEIQVTWPTAVGLGVRQYTLCQSCVGSLRRRLYR